MRALLFVALLSAATLGGCATAGSSGGSPGSGGAPDVISSDELRQIDADNLTAMEAIQRLRATWLRSRGSTFGGGRTEPMVFVDGIEFGEMGSLRNVNITDVERIRYLDASDATTRFGTGYPGGVIAIETR